VKLCLLAVLAGAGALAAGCGGGGKSGAGSTAAASAAHAYPKAVVSTYMRSCQAQAKVSSGRSTKVVHAYCGCTLDYLERHLSYAKFKAADKAAGSLSAAPPDAKRAFNGAIKTCRAKIS
jgi:hypothetical protein